VAPVRITISILYNISEKSGKLNSMHNNRRTGGDQTAVRLAGYVEIDVGASMRVGPAQGLLCGGHNASWKSIDVLARYI